MHKHNHRHGHDTLAGLAALMLALAQLPGCDDDKDPRTTDSAATEDSAGDTESCEASGEGSGSGGTGATSQAGSCGAEDGSSGATPTTGDDPDPEPAGKCEGERCVDEMGIYCAPGLECVAWEEENGEKTCRKRCHFQAGECGEGFECNFQPSGNQPQPYCDPRPDMCGDSTVAPQ